MPAGQVDSSGFADGVQGLVPGAPYAGFEIELPGGMAAAVGVNAKTANVQGAFLFARAGWVL